MSLSSIKRLTRLARQFRTDARGNVAIIFALVSIPLVALVGAAVDYTRAASARTALQSALDSAALMISKDAAGMSDSAITTRARQYVDSLYTAATDTPIESFTAKYTPNTGSGATIELGGGGNMPTYFMRVMGSSYDTLPIKATSTTNWGSNRTRVALVLDNTGSMSSNGKMDALKSAATDMITKLASFNSVTGDVYISIVPFAKDVNVDPSSNLSASWLNWTEWEAEPPYLTSNGYPSNWKYIGPGQTCPFTSNSYGFYCMDRPATLPGAKNLANNPNNNVIPTSGDYAGMICPSIDNGKKLKGKTDIYYNGCYTSVVDQTKTISSGRNASCGSTDGCLCTGSGKDTVCTQTTYKHYWRNHPTDTNQAKNAAPPHSTWTGCVNDRDKDSNKNYDTTNDAMSGGSTSPSKLPYAEQWSDCLPATITSMSNQWSDLKTQINAMTPSGNTNQAIGLFWGWQTLNTANDPYKAPAKDANWVYQDYIVVLSDGMNTQNRWSTSQSDIDARQATLCSNIKDPSKNGGNQITIFAVQVNVNNKDPESQVLKNCAKSPNPPYFQVINQSGQTADAFNSILAQIAKLRISK
jgi:Flp pilus assembly protein TadG